MPFYGVLLCIVGLVVGFGAISCLNRLISAMIHYMSNKAANH